MLERWQSAAAQDQPLNIAEEMTPRNRRMQKTIRALDAVVYDIIAARRQRRADQGDLLSLLLSARDEETGQGMSDQQVRDEVMTLLLAGHETTAVALSWAWYL